MGGLKESGVHSGIPFEIWIIIQISNGKWVYALCYLQGRLRVDILTWPVRRSGWLVWTESVRMTEWQLQDAKNRFSAVVDAAVAGDPQRVTRRGKPAVVVLAVEEYERLCHLEKAKAPMFADLLLAMPQDDEEFERLSLPSRSTDF